ncbi:MAG: hypothetical protein PT118_05700 [Aphanizomenon gracile PMC644.10]|nr:hypothetical protein [Aphanizomenon gracile PMC644.10]
MVSSYGDRYAAGIASTVASLKLQLHTLLRKIHNCSIFVVLIENFFMHLWNLANPLDFFQQLQ